MFNGYKEVIPMGEMILRLQRAGFTAEAAWNTCYEYFHRRDFKGLEEHIKRQEEQHGRYAKADGLRHV